MIMKIVCVAIWVVLILLAGIFAFGGLLLMQPGRWVARFGSRLAGFAEKLE